MTELELIRTPGDRRRYALEDIGTIHLEGLFARSANAEAGSDHWQFVRSGFWQRVMQATDATGNVVGEFRPRDLRRGGTLEWAGRDAHASPGQQLARALCAGRRRRGARHSRRQELGPPAGLREHRGRPSRRTGRCSSSPVSSCASSRSTRRTTPRPVRPPPVEHVRLAPTSGRGESGVCSVLTYSYIGI